MYKYYYYYCYVLLFCASTLCWCVSPECKILLVFLPFALSLNNGAYFVQVLPRGFPSLTGRWICGYSLPLWACGAAQLLCCDAFCSIILMWSFTTERTSGHGSLAGNPKPLETKGPSLVGLSVLPMCRQILLQEVEKGEKLCEKFREDARMGEMGQGSWKERKKASGSERWYLITRVLWE